MGDRRAKERNTYMEEWGGDEGMLSTCPDGERMGMKGRVGRGRKGRSRGGKGGNLIGREEQ